MNKINDLATALEYIEYLEVQLEESNKTIDLLTKEIVELNDRCQHLSFMVAQSITDSLITQRNKYVTKNN